MARASKRSSTTGGSSSQPTQSKRRRRRDEEEEEEVEEEQVDLNNDSEEEEGSEDGDYEGNNNRGTQQGGEDTPFVSKDERMLMRLSNEELERKVKGIVRLALSKEFRREPVKRDEFTKKVMKEHARAFKPVFVKANARLQDIFGLTMVELPSREKAASTSAAARRAQIAKEKAGKVGTSNAYILKNVLPGNVRDGVVSWDPEEQEWMVMLTVVLALIYVNDRVLSNESIINYLKVFRIRTKAPGLQSDPVFDNADTVLDKFVKLGYLERIKLHAAVGTTAANELTSYEYRWGPRAKVEFEEEACADFICTVLGEDTERLRKEIVRASGKDVEA